MRKLPLLTILSSPLPQSWIRDLAGTVVDEDVIWNRLNQLSAAAEDKDDEDSGCSVSAVARPFGERHNPGSVFGLESISLASGGHLPLGQLYR